MFISVPSGLLQFGKQHALTVKQRQKPDNEEFIQILSASENLQQALTFWWMTWSSSCCMQYWLWSSITQSVFGHPSRALVQGTISISIAPPSVAARKTEIFMSAGTMVPSVCFCRKAVIFLLCHKAIQIIIIIFFKMSFHCYIKIII